MFSLIQAAAFLVDSSSAGLSLVDAVRDHLAVTGVQKPPGDKTRDGFEEGEAFGGNSAHDLVTFLASTV